MARAEITGVNELLTQLEALNRLAPLARPMARSTLRVQGHISSYSRVAPPAVPTYRRGYGPVNSAGRVTRYTSEKFSQRWTSEVRTTADGSLEGVVGNNATYGPYVMAAVGEPQQAYMHRGRWRTDQQVLDAETDWITQEFEAALQAAIREGDTT